MGEPGERDGRGPCSRLTDPKEFVTLLRASPHQDFQDVGALLLAHNPGVPQGRSDLAWCPDMGRITEIFHVHSIYIENIHTTIDNLDSHRTCLH